MNDVREIVTRAVLAKGRKTLKVDETVFVSSEVSSVLGCWIINHNFQAKEVNEKIMDRTPCFAGDYWPYSLI